MDPTNASTQAVIAVLGGESSAAVQAAIDPWGNVRIPSLQYHSDYDVNNPQKWLQTPWNERMMSYSSLVGNPVSGINRSLSGNTSFQISSNFQTFDVSSLIHSLLANLATNIEHNSVPRGSSSKNMAFARLNKVHRRLTVGSQRTLERILVKTVSVNLPSPARSS